MCSLGILSILTNFPNIYASPLILVRTNLYMVVAFLVSVTSKAVMTLGIKADTSLLSPLNGVQALKLQ
jgi:hypothetical protein